jgi:hypothetical protein
LFFLPFTWGRHRRAPATTALPRATSLELLILFGVGDFKHIYLDDCLTIIPVAENVVVLFIHSRAI